MKKTGLFFITTAFLFAFSCSVFAADYLVTLKDGVNAAGLEPICEQTNLYLTDEQTARSLYANGSALSITEDEPLDIPDPVSTQTDSSASELVPFSSTYDDPYFSEQLYFDELEVLDYIDTYKPTGQVRIAMIDTGINTAHQEFANASIEQGYNFVTDTTDTSDVYGHGTRTAGVIASGTNDGLGCAGIAPNATLVPLVVLTKVNGTAKGSTSHLCKAIKAAVDDYDCKIINVSAGVKTESTELNGLVEYAVENGVIVISAAGNDGANSDSDKAAALSYPASCDGAISVGATNADGSRASYSQKNSRVDVVAYGGRYHLPSNGGTSAYTNTQGTSFSCPAVVGAAALFISNHPDITAEEFSYILKGAAADTGELGRDDYLGYGIPKLMTMEKLYASSMPAFVSSIEDSDNDRNIKLAAMDSVSEAALIAAYFDGGSFVSCDISPLAFEGNSAYIALTVPDEAYTAKYFIWQDLDSMKCLSDVFE